MPNHFFRTSGRAVIWTPILILFSCLALYLATKYGAIYMSYYQIKQAFNTVGWESSRLTDEEFRADLERRLYSINPPFRPSDVAISRVGNLLIIDANYKVSVEHPFLEPHVMKFNPHVEIEVPAHRN